MVASSISYRVVCRSDVAVSRLLRLIQACGERSLILSIVAHLGLRSGSRTQKRRESGLGHVWTAPAVQEESDYQRSVRVRSCIRPLSAAVWPLALM